MEKKEGEPEEIIVSVSQKLLDMDLPYPIYLHPSQEMFRTEGHGLVLILKAVPDEELITNICSYGSNMIVKSPESLRQVMRARIKAALDQYKNDL